jgi:hypothetical protein
MLRPDQQLPARQPANLLEVKDQIIFSTTSVFESVTLPKRRRNSEIIDATIDAKGKLSHRALE